VRRSGTNFAALHEAGASLDDVVRVRYLFVDAAMTVAPVA
jgi:enamine deaminase RidA (YjgF/YER057c/UK114 family)